jgi:16S rRNA processing protein RimM
MAKRIGSGGKPQPEPDFLNVARVVRPWGVRGDVKIELLISDAENLTRARQVYIGEPPRAVKVQRVHLHGGSILLKLAGYDTPEQAEALRDQVVSIPRADAIPLRANQYYHHQILGLSVVTAAGEALGQIVEIVETGANDVYVVKGPRGEVLLPARVEVVKRVDLETRQMTVELLPGLLPD